MEKLDQPRQLNLHCASLRTSFFAGHRTVPDRGPGSGGERERDEDGPSRKALLAPRTCTTAEERSRAVRTSLSYYCSRRCRAEADRRCSSTVQEFVLVCVFPWCLTKAFVAPSAPTGLAARPETLCGPRGGFWPHLSRNAASTFHGSVASCFPSFRLAGRVLTEHLMKILSVAPHHEGITVLLIHQQRWSLSVQKWATHLLEGLRVQDAVASRCPPPPLLSLSPLHPHHFVQLVPVLLEGPWCGHCGATGSLSGCYAGFSVERKNPADSGFNRFELAVLALWMRAR